MRWLLLALVVIAATPAAHAQAVRILDSVGDRAFDDLDGAVAVARSGDVLLVAEGTYGHLRLVEKGLSVLAVPKANVRVRGVSILDLQDRNVVIQGLDICGQGAGVYVRNCRRHIRVQDCQILGAQENYVCCPYPGVDVMDAANILFRNCSIKGGWGFHDQGWGGDGASGMEVVSYDRLSFVSLFGCTVTGGAGAEGFPAGNGGSGVVLENSWVCAPRTSHIGGNGGDCEDDCSPGGRGGTGFEGDPQSVAWFSMTTNTGGYGGYSGGPKGSDLDFLGHLRYLTEVPPTFSAPAVVHDGVPMPVTVEGKDGDCAYVALASRPHFFFEPALLGAWLVPKGTLVTAVPLGELPPGGAATFDLALPTLPAHVARERYFAQGFVVTAAGAFALGAPLHFVVLNYDGSPDCNANGIQDYVDVIDNVFPAGDCNHNLVPDDCDIANGTSQDANGNGIPDECE